jgi:hypothetical protein
LAQTYDVTIIAVRPGTHPQALAVLGKADDPALLACWYSDIGAVNQILLIREIENEAVNLKRRLAALGSSNPFGIGELITGMAMDTYVPFDFIAPLRPGAFGPCYEVRTYELKPGGLAPTRELWRKAVPAAPRCRPDAGRQHRAVFQRYQRVLDYAHSFWKSRGNHGGPLMMAAVCRCAAASEEDNR